MVKVAPSLLSANFACLKDDIEKIENGKADWLHYDVMDGHFVPNISFGYSVLKDVSKVTNLFLDVHLMISDPEYYAPIFVKAGADMITFHVESFDNDTDKCLAFMQKMQDLHVQVGFTLRPATPIEPFEALLEQADMVLVMSVNPGFGGQSFMDDQLDKVRWLYKKREEKQLNYRIEIDGGINHETYKKACDAGCDTLVAGSYVFKNDIVSTIEGLLK